MLTLLLSVDWTANREAILKMVADQVYAGKAGQILMVPELISHDTERRLCAAAGDTASRFAEVLTFTRLAKRVSDAVGFGTPECLDNGGRLVAMASATRQLHSKLKAYAAVETRPEFLSGLLDAVDEFKRCCISPEDLLEASRRSEGSFAQKLEELSLIMEAYNSICAQGKQDPRDQMTWLLEQLEECDFAAEHVFYIDGFPDFTKQHTAILRHLMMNAPEIVVSLNCDSIDSQNPAFEKASATAKELLQIAREAGVNTNIQMVDPSDNTLRRIIPYLFQGKLRKNMAPEEMLRLYQTESIYKECHMAAEEIIRLVQSGCRYRDISIVCTDIGAYANMLNMVFERFHIPVYQSGTEDILDKTVITTVLSAIDVAVGDFEQADVIRYLKSALSPLDIEICDKVENYAIIWSITGKKWCEVWENHPEGLGTDWADAHKEQLLALNFARSTAIEPLFRLSKGLKKAQTLGQMIEAVYSFLTEVHLDERLFELSKRMENSGDLRNGQVLGQLWEILLSALEQLNNMLGGTYWDAQTFTKLLRLLLGQYDVGTIPAVLDAVTVGPVAAMRCQQPEHLLILGASEGNFPAYSGSTGVLTDQERIALRQMGVPLTGGAMEGLQAEFAEIYSVFCGAEKSVTVSCSSGQPSFLYRRLIEMAGHEQTYSPLGFSAVNPQEAGAYFVRNNAEKYASYVGLQEQCRQLKGMAKHSFGTMQKASIQGIYGQKLNLSASQVDKLADCRFAYFLKYGLRLKERKPAEVDPAEFGTYVHAVLEETGRKVMEMGGFHQVPLESTIQIANEYSVKYISERFSQIDSERIRYLFKRNVNELEMVVSELWQELQESEFEPIEFELAFGLDNSLDAIAINGNSLSAQLRGFVDRVDAWSQNGQIYYRVVDYKTGKKDFDYCDVFNGLGLQMLLYMFALEENGTEILGKHPVAAGVQYFPARAPLVSVDGYPEDAEAVDARDKLWKRKGLLLEDETVLRAMEPSEQPKRLSVTRKRDGTISGDLADREQLKLLKGYVFALLGKMVDDIASGCVEPNPYTRGSRHNACSFCPYGTICHQSSVEGRREYAMMTSQKFWEEVEKEMSNRG